jgi:hypothetical protein
VQKNNDNNKKHKTQTSGAIQFMVPTAVRVRVRAPSITLPYHSIRPCDWKTGGKNPKHPPSNAKVAEGNVERRRHEDVAGLEVAVNHLLPVHKDERLNHLAKPLFEHGLGQRLLAT